MKKNLLVGLMLFITCITLAQTNYRELLVRGQRTYWATAVSLFNEVDIIEVDGDDSVHVDFGQAGMCLYQNGCFQWYKITNENDTFPFYGGIDTEVFISHRSYELHQDTLFIIAWHIGLDENNKRKNRVEDAYKILYLTEQKMLLLQLSQTPEKEWVEHTFSPRHESTIIEYRYMGVQ